MNSVAGTVHSAIYVQVLLEAKIQVEVEYDKKQNKLYIMLDGKDEEKKQERGTGGHEV